MKQTEADKPTILNEELNQAITAAKEKVAVETKHLKWIKDWRIERARAISDMFNNADELGIYPTTKFFDRIDQFWIDKLEIKCKTCKIFNACAASIISTEQCAKCNEKALRNI